MPFDGCTSPATSYTLSLEHGGIDQESGVEGGEGSRGTDISANRISKSNTSRKGCSSHPPATHTQEPAFRDLNRLNRRRRDVEAKHGAVDCKRGAAIRGSNRRDQSVSERGRKRERDEEGCSELAVRRSNGVLAVPGYWRGKDEAWKSELRKPMLQHFSRPSDQSTSASARRDGGGCRSKGDTDKTMDDFVVNRIASRRPYPWPGGMRVSLSWVMEGARRVKLSLNNSIPWWKLFVLPSWEPTACPNSR